MKGEIGREHFFIFHSKAGCENEKEEEVRKEEAIDYF